MYIIVEDIYKDEESISVLSLGTPFYLPLILWNGGNEYACQPI